tara:strand:+ start:1290 stop:2915 length:1626 start_codon:yes stop_codon:yes gene_type:complete
MNKTLLENFPEGYTPRDYQEPLLERIDEALNSKKKFIIISAPTGTGKSFISKAVANWSREHDSQYIEKVNSYAAYAGDGQGNYKCKELLMELDPGGTFGLTITKTLQDQYADMFENTGIIKGKTNYQCEVDPNFDVESAPCVLKGGSKIKKGCWTENICPYYNARNAALTNKFSSLNYSMFFAIPEFLRRRHVLVCDEASELENELVSTFSVVIEYKQLERLGVESDMLKTAEHTSALKWIYGLNGLLSTEIQTYEQMTKLKPAQLKRMKLLKNLQRKVQSVCENWTKCKYVIDPSAEQVSYTPLRVNYLSNHLFDHGEKIILMSATIIDYKKFAKILGIPEDQFTYIEVPSKFPAKKSPIFMTGDIKLNYKTMDAMLPKVVKAVNHILEHHKNDKGVIHTHTHKITKYLQDHIKSSRLIFREKGVNNEALLKEHLNTDHPTVLVSPSMGFGISLDDDLARFQIVVKAAYPSLGDKRTKELFDVDKGWYTNTMLSAFIQQCGRGTRSAEDYCATYVIDSNVKDVIVRNNKKLPKAFIDRIY